MISSSRLDRSGVLQIVLYLAVITELIFLAGFAIRWALADIHAKQVNHHLKTLDRNLSNKSADQWRLAKERLDRTLQLRSSDASYLKLAGRFYQRLSTLEGRNVSVIRELKWHRNEEQALKYTRLALRFAPSDASLWGQLIISKVALFQLDGELANAVSRANDLGPWFRAVQYRVALAGIGMWPYLSDDVRPEILLTVERILEMDHIRPNRHYGTKQILSHANFTLLCKEKSDSVLSRLQSHCH